MRDTLKTAARQEPGREPAADGRTRRRLATTRRVQALALDLFEARGFDATSVEDVARAAEVAPATVYRAFGTKEGIVMWDEYDPALLLAFAHHLAAAPPAEAMLAAVLESLAVVYTRDRARILRRARLMRKTPSVARLATSGLVALRDALVGVLAATPGARGRSRRDPLADRVVAAALVVTLEAAIDLWLDDDGRRPLARCLRMAFARLGALAAAR